MPPLHGFPRSPSAPPPSDRGPPSYPDLPTAPERPSGSLSPPTQRSSSTGEHRPNDNGPGSLRPRENGRSSGDIPPVGQRTENMSSLVLSPEAQVHQGAQRVPSLHDPLPSPMYPRSVMAAQPCPGPTVPGGVVPPARSTSFTSPHDPFSRAGPGLMSNPATVQPISPPSFHPPPPHTLNHPQFPPRQQPPYGSHGVAPGRPPSDPSFQGGIRKSPSSRSLTSQYEPPRQNSAPPMPSFPGGYPPPNNNIGPRSDSYGSLHAPQPRPLLPSAQMNSRSFSMADPSSFHEPSPPNSPVQETAAPTGPVTSTISAQMKCKVFLQQQHAQWKSLGSAKLKLYRQQPTNVKQLVVEADNKDKSVLISTIVLTDGVERVGKTGVAIELSDKGTRTGIIYMIQLRNESSAGGLFDSLLAGSDRAGRP